METRLRYRCEGYIKKNERKTSVSASMGSGRGRCRLQAFERRDFVVQEKNGWRSGWGERKE
jgi:hypothetical protein